jgi:hypothetical protein
MEAVEHVQTTPPFHYTIDHTMKLRTSEKPAKCPWCGADKIALLLSGMPVFLPEMETALDDGGIAIGGLEKGNDQPAWQCTECCAQFFRDTPVRGSRPQTPS